jgi:hypothetical protein
VASEVKELAEQTSSATQQISAQINAIQSASEKTAASTDRTLQAVRQLGELATSCAAAIDQQRVATTEIAESAQRADSGSSDAASSVAKVVEFTHQTDEISKSVLSAAQEMADRHEAWKEEFESFVQTDARFVTHLRYGQERGRAGALFFCLRPPQSEDSRHTLKDALIRARRQFRRNAECTYSRLTRSRASQRRPRHACLDVCSLSSAAGKALPSLALLLLLTYAVASILVGASLRQFETQSRLTYRAHLRRRDPRQGAQLSDARRPRDDQRPVPIADAGRADQS